ncbi:MAG: hypothetical protein DME19_09030 [Verrucomicrobia bacterium]|nr:MAG: hypothetical protein DME19_09030 [Verrucomicrobiota bacterium]
MPLFKANPVGLVAWGFLSGVLLGVGCTKSNRAPAAAVSVEQAPATIETAFRDAPSEARQQATEAVTALRSQNDAAAFVQLQNLSGRSDLTAEQRQAAFASWMAVNQRLQQSAANGNSAAQDLLEKYRASK